MAHQDPTTETQQQTSGDVNDKVKSAFEQAAKELGIKVGFSSKYCYVDEECPPGTDDDIKKVQEKCGVVNNSKNQETKGDTQVDEDKKCAVGNPSERTAVTTRPGLLDTIPGTSWNYKTMIKSDTFEKYRGTQTAGQLIPSSYEDYWKTMTLDQISNITFAAQQLAKFMQLTGASGSINSGIRSEAINTIIGGSASSSHKVGYAIDLKVSGSTNKLFERLIELYNKGTLCGYQFIREVHPGQVDSGIIHFDFNPSGSGSKGVKVMKGVGGNYGTVAIKDVAGFNATLKQLGA